MRETFADVWQELREKRLWPVAVLLVVAILAVPVALSKSPDTPAAPPQATAPPVADTQTAVVTLDDGGAAGTAQGSSLDSFTEGDPFSPPKSVTRGGGVGATASASSAGPDVSSSPGEKTTDGGGGTNGGDPAPAPPPPTTRTETAEYQYVADVTFWNGDRRRQVRGLRKLDMLPNEAAPVLIFMGTTGNGGNAVFLVDSNLRAVGEGRCVPSRANCVYVHIGPGAEHAFTTEAGDSYRMRVEEIRRVKVGPRASRRAAASSGAPRKPFSLPRLVDTVAVTETTTAAGPSSSDPGKRR